MHPFLVTWPICRQVSLIIISTKRLYGWKNSLDILRCWSARGRWHRGTIKIWGGGEIRWSFPLRFQNWPCLPILTYVPFQSQLRWDEMQGQRKNLTSLLPSPWTKNSTCKREWENMEAGQRAPQFPCSVFPMDEGCTGYSAKAKNPSNF